MPLFLRVRVQPHAQTDDEALALTASACARVIEEGAERQEGLQLVANPIFGELKARDVKSMLGTNWMRDNVRERPDHQCDCLVIR
jgi:hypothetical protein